MSKYCILSVIKSCRWKYFCISAHDNGRIHFCYFFILLHYFIVFVLCIGLCHVLLLIVFCFGVSNVYIGLDLSLYVLLCFQHYTDVVPHAMQRLSIASEHYYEQ